MRKTKKLTFFALFSAIIASFGGVLFGYNTSVISGAILFIAKEYHFTDLQQALIVSTLLLGALFGSLLAGYLVDKIGRRPTLFFSVFLFGIGTILLMSADALFGFLLGRFILGIGVGIVSLAVPLYIAEIAPILFRGALVSINQLAITVGILLGYSIDYAYADLGEWKWMFGFTFFPLLLLFFGLFLISETPSFLAAKGKKKEARNVMAHLRGKNAEGDISMEGNHEKRPNLSFKALFHKSTKAPFITGVGLSIFQAITGVNIVIYYAPRIFQMAGYASEPSAIFATIGIGIVNVIMTLVALWLIDRVGRRPLLVVGLIGMSLSLFMLGISFFDPKRDLSIFSTLSVISYVAFFAVSLGPIAWLIIAEIFPLNIRGKAMGIAIFANWSANYIISLTFLNLAHLLSITGVFWLYTFICLIALWFVSRKIPETRNKSFAEIQSFWEKEKAV